MKGYRIDLHANFDFKRDHDALTAKRAEPRPPPVARRIKGYVAYDAHSLLEHESEGDRARPGHPLG